MVVGFGLIQLNFQFCIHVFFMKKGGPKETRGLNLAKIKKHLKSTGRLSFESKFEKSCCKKIFFMKKFLFKSREHYLSRQQ